MKRGKSFEGFLGRAKESGHRFACLQAHFDRTDGFLGVVRMNALAGRRVEAAEQTVRESGPPGITQGELGAQGFVAGRTFEQTVQQGLDVEAGTARYDWQAAPGLDSGEHRTGFPGVLPGTESLVRQEDVQQVMGDSMLLILWSFCGPDVEETVKLKRVAIDHFAPELRGDGQG